MNVMLKMPSVALTTYLLGMTGRLSVEWARGERGRHHDGRAAKQRPTKTLFVINFDPVRTRDYDIERHFEPYGKVLNVQIRRNFAFVQFETLENATKALECTHMSKILDRVVSVEYALRDDDDRGGIYDSPRRDYARRGGGPSRRSPSPGYRRSRLSPDYGRARSCMSITKLFFGLRTCHPGHMEEAAAWFDKGLCGSIEDIVVCGGPFFGDPMAVVYLTHPVWGWGCTLPLRALRMLLWPPESHMRDTWYGLRF